MDPFGPDQPVIESGLEPVQQFPRDRRIGLRVRIGASEKAAPLRVGHTAEVAGRIAMAEFDRPRRRTFELILHPSTRPSSSRSRRRAPTGATRLANAGRAVTKMQSTGS